MLTKERNERLTQVGRGTPMGELFRRYWHPVAVNSELVKRPTKPVRILGEDLVLYRDTSGSGNALSTIRNRPPAMADRPMKNHFIT